MNGKVIVILAIGFSAIFMLFGNDFFNISRVSTNDMVENIGAAKALDIARSATEVVVSHYWQHPDEVELIGTHKTYFDSVDFNDGKVVSTIDLDPSEPDLYKDDPRDGASDDLLGLVTSGLVEVADTPPNQTDIEIQAAIYYSAWAGLTAENAQTKADAGDINFFGSLIEHERKAVGKFDPDTGQLWGYGRNYDYDERLRKISPPGFPQLSGFNVLAWYEGESAKTL